MVLRQAQNSIGYLSPLIELRQISFRSWRRVPLLKRGILLLSQNKLDLCLVCWRKNLLQDIILGQLDYVKHITGVDRHESRFPLLHGSNEKKTNGDLIFLMAEFAGSGVLNARPGSATTSGFLAHTEVPQPQGGAGVTQGRGISEIS
ncbi:unnamed protein product [Brassica oleracea var. botrytis]